MNAKRWLTLLCAVLLMSGCAYMKDKDGTVSRIPSDQDLVSESYVAADTLVAQVPWLKENRQPLLTGSFVDVSSLENSSPFGRIVAEQISSRFAQKGFSMVEMKLRRNVFIKQRAGEFMLSREVRQLSQAHNAAAVIAGTYAIGRRNVYVSARLVRAADNLVIASFDYSLPMGPDTRALLAAN